LRQNPATLAASAARLDAIGTELAASYDRWETLAELE